jgi:methionine synthase I (cobalamin-dependent)
MPPHGSVPAVIGIQLLRLCSNLERAEAVARAYVEAGSQIILTNTFRANVVAMSDWLEDDLDAINRAGVGISRQVAEHGLVFASLRPTGKMLLAEEIDSEQVLAAFAAQSRSLAAAGADALLVETMSDIEEERLAVEAAKSTGLPVMFPSPSTPARTTTAP